MRNLMQYPITDEEKVSAVRSAISDISSKGLIKTGSSVL